MIGHYRWRVALTALDVVAGLTSALAGQCRNRQDRQIGVESSVLSVL